MINNNFEIKISQLGDKFPQIGGKFNQSEFNNHISSELGKIKLENPLNIDVETLAKERFGHGLYVKSADQKSEYILDERGTTILLFEGEGNGKFESIYSPLSKEQLRREILVLPVEQQEDLSKMLKLPEPTQEDLEEFKMIQTGRESDKNLLNAALKLPEGIHSGSIEEKDIPPQSLIRGIVQKEYAITNADSDIPVIGTFGLGPCIALTIFNPESRTAALAHVDGSTNIDSLDRIFEDLQIQKDDLQKLQVGLVGGDSSSRKRAVEMIKFLQNKGLKITFADILDKAHPSAFVLDSRNGILYPNIAPSNNGEFVDLRMKGAGLQMNAQIKKEFDGRISKG